MSVALSEFWTRLVRNGFSDAEGCKQLAADYAQASDGRPPADSLSLANYLVGAGKLNEFQAEALLMSQPVAIKQGRYLQRQPHAAAPLTGWIPVVRDDGVEGVLFRPSSEQRGGGRDQWLAAHASVVGASLQPIVLDSIGNDDVVFSPLPPGQLLFDVLAKPSKIPLGACCRIAVALCDAVVALHAASLWHGAIRTDRVWFSTDGRAILLRDPAGPPASPYSETPAAWLDTLASPMAYAAPEFCEPATVCGAATDIYSFGCLLYRLIAGEMPFTARTASEMMSLHASHLPQRLADAVASKASGDPLMRVIAYAMAKNPQARLPSAKRLSEAFHAAVAILDPASATVPIPSENNPDAPAPAPARGTVALPKIPVLPPVQAESVAAAKSKPIAAQAAMTTPKQVPHQSAAAKDKTTPGKPLPPKESAAVNQAAVNQAAVNQAAVNQAAVNQAAVNQAAGASQNSSGKLVTVPAVTVPAAAGADTAGPAAADPSSTNDSKKMRRRRKKSKKTPLILGGLVTAVLMLVIVLLAGGPRQAETESPKQPRLVLPRPLPSSSGVADATANSQAKTASTETGPAAATMNEYEVIGGDSVLWMPPYTMDSPPPLTMLPPGPAVILSIHLSQLLDSEAGTAWIEAFAPELSDLINTAASRAKMPVESIQRLSVTLHAGDQGWPEVSLGIELRRAESLEQLIEKWDAEASQTTSGATVYAGDQPDSDAYFVKSDDRADKMVSAFAVGSLTRIQEVAENDGGSLPLPRNMQSLWNATSRDADLVLLATPNFLFADSRMLLQQAAPGLVDPLKSLLIPDAAAAMLTTRFDAQRFYGELRLAPSGGISEAQLMQSLREASEGMPAWAENFILTSVADSSWRLLANRLPSMMRFASAQTRFGVSNTSAVANLYLPANALPQWSLATLLALNTSDSGADPIVSKPTTEMTLEQLLSQPMSISFDQESLEFGVNMVVEQFAESLPEGTEAPTVRIIGGDLQKMGITQNQQVRAFEKKNLPLRQVLTELLLGANPDKTASGANDPKQSLIWVVADDPAQPGKKTILVTTRQAAEGKYDLPEEFVVAP